MRRSLALFIVGGVVAAATSIAGAGPAAASPSLQSAPSTGSAYISTNLVVTRSDTTTGVTVPSAPGGVDIVDSTVVHSLTIRWTAPANDGGSPIIGYRVSRDGVDLTGAGPWSEVVDGLARSYTFTGLNFATNYTFTVQAINSVGTGPGAYAHYVTAPDAQKGTYDMYDVVIHFDAPVSNSFTANYYDNDNVVTYRFYFHYYDSFGGLTLHQFKRKGGYHPTMFIVYNRDGQSSFSFPNG